MKTNSYAQNNRRQFLKGVAFTVGGTLLGLPLLAQHNRLLSGNSIPEAQATLSDKQQKRKLGIALVGLGQYSTNELAPALQETEHCYLAGIVTGTPTKASAWKKKYNIPDKNIYSYETFDQIANNKDIDIVYMVLPSALHAEYTIRAAKAKKHVICEKPMATSVEDAQRMIDACRENKVQLAIGYRLHFEPFHQRVMELGQKQVYGTVKQIEARNSSNMTDGNLDVWRLNKELAGGGSLMDLGVYCVQGAIYTMGKPPVAVTARYGEVTKPAYFHSVEQSVRWQMEFEGGVVAECNTSYAEDENLLSAKAEKGWWRISPAYAYEGKKGETSEGKMDLPNIFEQVRQMDGQAQSFRNNQPSIVPGEMGLRDMRVLMAIYESADAGGKRVPIRY